MTENNYDLIPRAKQGLKPSLPSVILVLAILILAGIWSWGAFQDFRRQEILVKDLRMESADTLIHTLAASARSTVFAPGPGGGVTGLVEEAAAQKEVAFIVLLDARGRVVAAAGSWRGETLVLPVDKALAAKGRPMHMVTTDAQGVPVFVVAREFKPLEVQGPISEEIYRRYLIWCGLPNLRDPKALQQAIFVGFYTEEYDQALRADSMRNIGQGLLLLVFGSLALYLLFVTHGSKVARETLNTMELYTRNVIDSMPAGLLTLDAKGLLVSYNLRALELLGILDTQPEGQNLSQLMGEPGQDLMDALTEQDEILEAPLECRRLDGIVVPMKVSASRLRNQDGFPLGAVLILRDLREIREMEQQLERSRRHAALGLMATGIAHEIRNPLGTLKGFAQFFARIGKGDPAAEEYADLMVGEVDRLNRTISALLQYAKPREPEFQEIDLRSLMERTGRFVEGDMADHDLRFFMEMPTDGTILQADPDQMTQVLLNLLQNALSSTDPEGEICLGAQKNDDEVRLWVKDTGVGMDEEQAQRIFDPFFTTRKTGTGLGLAVVHQIVEQHRGRIEVVSSPGEGTTMTLIFPVR